MCYYFPVKEDINDISVVELKEYIEEWIEENINNATQQPLGVDLELYMQNVCVISVKELQLLMSCLGS